MITKIQNFNTCHVTMMLRQAIARQSLLEVVGVERKETRHSRFLQWLFSNPELNVSSCDSPLFHLLDAIIFRDELQKKLLDENFVNKIICRNITFSDVKVKCEVATQGVTCNGKKGLIDLLISATAVDIMDDKNEFPISIVIENKVDSNEHDDQTEKYHAYMTGKSDQRYVSFNKNYNCPKKDKEQQIFVYLTPTTIADMGNDLLLSSNSFVHICYQDIVDFVLDPVYAKEGISQDVKLKIEQYLITLSIPAVAEGDDAKTTNASAMAVSSRLKTLALAFWGNHYELVNEAVRNSNNSLMKMFMNAHKSLIEAVLNALVTFVIPGQDMEKKKYESVLSLRCAINKKYLIKVDSILKEVNQAALAVEYATAYYKADSTKTVARLNQDFADVSGSLWGGTQQNRSDNRSKTNIQVAPGIYFRNNCWGNSPTNTNVPKLLDFINNNPVAGFEIV